MTEGKYKFVVPPEIVGSGQHFESGPCRNGSCASTRRITTWNKGGKLSSQCINCRNARARRYNGSET